MVELSLEIDRGVENIVVCKLMIQRYNKKLIDKKKYISASMRITFYIKSFYTFVKSSISLFWIFKNIIHVLNKVNYIFDRKSLDGYEKAYTSALNSVNPEYGHGEVTVKLPPECLPTVAG